MPATSTQTAIFAAGCFWGVEELFRKLDGVMETSVGYTGGMTEAPTYEDVCSSATGHAEAVKITYDPAKISYDKLLETFFDNHNPTTPNQQGPDFGSQYRSAVFYESDEQRAAAERCKEKVEKSGRWKKPVVTQIVPAQTFYPAEDYHQKYLMKRGLGSCHI
ncbi:MAG TPA: peptide-methionine (S)-S-oxide reductase MsrA [Candidatus Peribacteria bacterium]|nr:peptide-methionine (S)-S-oxide reductase MsrA [Candidatus Peribacteria bacterium]